MRRLRASLILPALVAASSSFAAERTEIVFDAPSVAAPRYSQALAVRMHLRREGGAAVSSGECGGCSIVLSVGPEGQTPVVVNPQGFVIDPDGSTSDARVVFVDETPAGATYPASADGAPYILRARFLGHNAQLATAGCGPTDDEVADGAFCPSTTDVAIALSLETPALILEAGLEGALGDSVTLRAHATDPNGDAAPGGNDADGGAPKNLAGLSVTFFYDVNNNGAKDAGEDIGPAFTDDAGVATLSFLLDPQYVRAGTYASGITAELSGGNRYQTTRSSTPLVVHPADADATKTILEIDPTSIVADGASTATLRARLVDRFNNPLDPQSDLHDVVFTTDLGRLLDSPARDPLSGTYTQTLQAQRKGGTATVTVLVDGHPGPTQTLEITGAEGGCQCAHEGGGPLAGLAVLCLARRRRGSSR